jgi:hypothetical protein
MLSGGNPDSKLTARDYTVRMIPGEVFDGVSTHVDFDIEPHTWSRNDGWDGFIVGVEVTTPRCCSLRLVRTPWRTLKP